MRKILTRADATKLDVVSQRLRDIFDRDKVNPLELGTDHYVVRAVVEALKIEHLFYQQGNSPFVPPSSNNWDKDNVVQWRREVDDTLKDLYSLIESIEQHLGIENE